MICDSELKYHYYRLSRVKMEKKIFIFSFIFLLFFPLFLLGQEKEVKVIAESANIHESPDEASPVVVTVKRGTVLYFFSSEKVKDIWYHVYFYSKARKATIAGYIQETMIETGVRISQEKEKKEVGEPREEIKEVVPEPLKVSRPKKTKTGFKYGVGVTGGYVMPQDDNYKGGIAFGGRFCLGFTKFLSFELSGINYRNNTEGSINGLSKGKLNILLAQFSIQARYPISERYFPYLCAGGGFYLNRFSLGEEITESWKDLGFDVEEEINKSSFGYHLGAGLDFFVAESIAFNVDLKYCFIKTKGTWTFTDQASGIETSGELDGLDLGAFMFGVGLKFCF